MIEPAVDGLESALRREFSRFRGKQVLMLRPHGRSAGLGIKRQHATGIWNFKGPRGFILKHTRAQAAQAAYGN